MYWVKVLSNWFNHVNILFAVVFFADLLFFATYSNGIDNVISPKGSGGGRGEGAAVFFMLFGPLAIHLFCWYNSVTYFWEAESDTYTASTIKPNAQTRLKYIYVSAPIISIYFITPLFWFYLGDFEIIWGKDRDFWGVLGFYCSAVVSILIGLIFLTLNKKFRKICRNIKKNK
jgi:hypothetical protein